MNRKLLDRPGLREDMKSFGDFLFVDQRSPSNCPYLFSFQKHRFCRNARIGGSAITWLNEIDVDMEILHRIVVKNDW
jgi:hypothetical protein